MSEHERKKGSKLDRILSRQEYFAAKLPVKHAVYKNCVACSSPIQDNREYDYRFRIVQDRMDELIEDDVEHGPEDLEDYIATNYCGDCIEDLYLNATEPRRSSRGYDI